MNTVIASALAGIISQIPIYIVWIVGMILGIVNFKRMKTAGIMSLIAFAVFLVTNIIFTFITISYPISATRNGIPIDQIAIVMTIKAAINSVIDVICWVLILLAIFMKRRDPTNQPAAPVSAG